MRKKFAIFLLLVVALGSSALNPTIRKRIFDFGSNGGFQAAPNAVPAFAAVAASEPETTDLDPYYVKGGGAINTASANAVSFSDRVASGGVHAPEPDRGLFSEEAVYRYPKFPVNDLAGFNYTDGSSDLPVEQMVFLPKSDNNPGSVPSSGPGGPFGGGLPNFGGGSPSGNDGQNQPGSGKDNENPTLPTDDGFPPSSNPPGNVGDGSPTPPTDTNYGLPPDQSFYPDDNTPPGGGGGGTITEPTHTETDLPSGDLGGDDTHRVPDSGSTLVLFGTALMTLAWVRRKMS